MSNLIFFITIFLLGFRHGFDFDHIAAISNITGASKNVKRGFFQSTMYVLGHALVVLIIGIIALAVGFSLPETYGAIIETLVGLSLIALGLYLLFSLFTKKQSFQLMGRGTLFVSLLQKTLLKKLHVSNGAPAAFVIGMLHGIGAETPTQVLLLSLAGTGGQVIGGIGLFLFITGLVLANTIVSLTALFGYAAFLDRPVIRMGLGMTMALFSLYVGISVFVG